MRYGIFSDVHSNLEAFQSVLEAYKDKNIDKYYCLGDVVGYSANPKECIGLIQDNKIETIAGNHDWALSGRFSMDYFNDYAKEALLWTQKHTSPEEKVSLDKLEISKQEKDFVLVHGTLYNPEEFHYMLDPYAIRRTFELMNCNLCFVGHTHCAEVFIDDKQQICYSGESLINLEPNKKYIINVGSVGQPRDRDPRASFCIYDSDKKEVEFFRIDYDMESTHRKVLNSGLPTFLANRILEGR